MSIKKEATSQEVINETKRPFVLAAIMLAMFMSAIEATIVSTAIPTIVADLGGFSLFSWVFSIFLLMQAVTIPIYGKLADLFGRKPVFTIGVVVFLIGSFLCGIAKTMPLLIFYRFIQGIGAGAVQPIATTIIGDLYTLEERAKVQGYTSSVWGISSIIGPTLGGIFVTYIHWHWVFWVNLPLGIIAILLIWLYLHENVQKKNHQIDYVGSGLLLVSISSIMIVLIQGGATWGWTSSQTLLLIAVFVVCIFFFILQEKRAAEPIMPLSIWNNRLIAVANLASLTTGAVMIGVSSFLPTFVQGVMERTPVIAGFTLATMSIGWPLAATFSGRLMKRIGFLKTALIGGVGLIIGSIFFITLKPEYGPIWAAVGSFLIGAGMGFATTTFIVSIQSSVDWSTRGVATASNMFMRILGNTVGVALLGGILNNQMIQYLASHDGSVSKNLHIDVTNTLLDPVERAKLSPHAVEVLQNGLTASLHSVYWVIFILAALSLAIIFFLPKGEQRKA